MDSGMHCADEAPVFRPHSTIAPCVTFGCNSSEAAGLSPKHVLCSPGGEAPPPPVLPPPPLFNGVCRELRAETGRESLEEFASLLHSKTMQAVRTELAHQFSVQADLIAELISMQNMQNAGSAKKPGVAVASHSSHISSAKSIAFSMEDSKSFSLERCHTTGTQNSRDSDDSMGPERYPSATTFSSAAQSYPSNGSGMTNCLSSAKANGQNGSAASLLSVGASFMDVTLTTKSNLEENRQADQFERLDQNCIGWLSPEICFAVADHHLETGCPSFRLISDTLKSFAKSTMKQDPERWAQLGSPEAFMDLPAFLHLMQDHDMHDLYFKYVKLSTAQKTRVLEVSEKLRIAFGKEEQHNFFGKTQEVIEARNLKMKEPEPTGWTAVFLEIIPSVVTIANSIVFAIQSDSDPHGSNFWMFDVAEIVFVVCFIIEAVFKYNTSGRYFYMFGVDRYWNYFDLFCIIVSLMDLFLTYVAKAGLSGMAQKDVLRMLRLSRMLRMVRVLHHPVFNELKLMLFGVIVGVRVLAWAIVLLFMCMFVLGVMLQRFVGNDVIECDSVPRAMFTVFRCFTDGCTTWHGEPLQERLRESYGITFMLCYVLAFMFVTFGLFNLIMAVFLDNVLENSTSRKQKEIGQSAAKTRVLIEETFAKLILQENPEAALRKSKVYGLVDTLAKVAPETNRRVSVRTIMQVEPPQNIFASLPSDFAIPRDIFNLWLQEPLVLSMMEASSIDVSDKFSIFDVLDVDMSGELELDELVSGLMTLRGPITKCDIVAVRNQLNYSTQMVQEMRKEKQREGKSVFEHSSSPPTYFSSSS